MSKGAEVFVYLRDIGEEFGLDGSNMRKWAIRCGVTPHKRRAPGRGNQSVLAVTEEEAVFLRLERASQGFGKNAVITEREVGVFYIIRLIPELDPNRIKFGFADDAVGRLTQHRTAAPTASIVKTWPCKRTWESAVIDCLSIPGCELIANEVFDCQDIDGLVEKADRLFALLPGPKDRPSFSQHSPHKAL